MTHDDAILAAVFAAPDDDAPRLDYADWLDEHGEPAYAELIRVQCAMARVAKSAAVYAQLARREQELLAAHAREWVGPLADRPGRVRFHRGFVRGLACDAAEFAAHAEELFRLVPLVWSLEAHYRNHDLWE